MSDDVKDELREAIRIGEDGSSTWLPDALARIEELEAEKERAMSDDDVPTAVEWKTHQAFHKLTVSQRDHAWTESAQRLARIEELEAAARVALADVTISMTTRSVLDHAMREVTP